MRVLFIPNAKKQKNGEAPLYCRLTFDGTRAEFSTKIYVKPERWNQKDQLLTGTKSKVVNKTLYEIRSNIVDLESELNKNNIGYTVKSFKKYLLEGIGDQISLSQLFDLYISHARTVNEVAKSTISKYETLKQKVIGFGDPEDIRNIPKTFAFKFHEYLKTGFNLSHNTSVKAMELLRAVLNFAVHQELIDKNPLAGYKLRKQRKEIIYLTKEELAKIETKEFASARLDFVRDVFVFQCYTGMEYSRVMLATYNNIQIGLDGKKWIYTTRVKTDQSSNVPVFDKAAEIIDKYRSNERAAIFPSRSNQKMNDYLKEIAILCGIEKNLTTHISRHTFATTICLLNGISMEATSKMLGHSSVKTTERHYGVIAPRRISEEVQGLREKLSAQPSEDPSMKSILHS